MESLKKYRLRLNVLLAFVPLLILDVMISLTTDQSFTSLRITTLNHLNKVWYKY